MTIRAIWVVLLLMASPAMAQPTIQPNAVGRGNINAGTVGVISGGVDGTYIRIAADLAAVLNDGDRLRILPIIGQGSLGNIADILFLHGVDVGIIQSDALAYVQRRRMYPGIERQMQYVTKLYDEELHVLAGKDISKLQDLSGKTVNVDVSGSGTAMTAAVVFGAYGISIKSTNDDQTTALEKLKKGDISALVYVTGRPASLFREVGADSGLHLVAVPMIPALLDTYLPSSLTHADYPMLVADGSPVESIAVSSVMAVYAWPPASERYRKVARFVRAMFDKFPMFLKPPRHPKWKEVNLAAQVPGWTRFPAAEEWLGLHSVGAPTQGGSPNAFDAFLSGSAWARANLGPNERAALLKQFVEWQKAHPR